MSIEKLIELSRQKLTDEEKSERQRKFEDRLKQYDKEMVERYRCRECGVDTINYSHSFKCSRRGENN